MLKGRSFWLRPYRLDYALPKLHIVTRRSIIQSINFLNSTKRFVNTGIMTVAGTMPLSGVKATLQSFQIGLLIHLYPIHRIPLSLTSVCPKAQQGASQPPASFQLATYQVVAGTFAIASVWEI